MYLPPRVQAYEVLKQGGRYLPGAGEHCSLGKVVRSGMENSSNSWKSPFPVRLPATWQEVVPPDTTFVTGPRLVGWVSDSSDGSDGPFSTFQNVLKGGQVLQIMANPAL